MGAKYDELYEGNIFEGMEEKLDEVYNEGHHNNCECDHDDCDCEDDCECDEEHCCCEHHKH